jgi:hypothetical protein
MNSNRVRAVWSCALLGTAMLLSGGSARAGASSQASAYCYTFSDGSGYCTGTLRKFHDSSDPSAVLAFQAYVSNGGTTRYVYTTWQSQTRYMWLDNPSAGMTAAFDRAATALGGSIYVHWNTSGFLDGLAFWNSSDEL